MPERYRIRYADSAEEVLSELQKFVDYVKNGPVMTLLPSALQNLSARNAGEGAKWQAQIARALRTRPLGASAACWLNLLDEMFSGARQRLDELSHAGDEAPSAPVPGKPSLPRPEA